MKRIVREFMRRGFAACGIGPIVLAIIYLILQNQAVIDTLTVKQVCIGIFSLSALAFVAGGMNVVYQIEQVPLMAAVFVHGGVLYISYLATYLINDWLVFGKTPIIVFTVMFVLGYVAVWAVIYLTTKMRTGRLNEVLQQKRRIEMNE